ncbi:CDP-glucose 4,6-dehydratase [Kitasatospora purpeofusca]|uniref:CDP-glucose 4,6-dehydratase n=1 Tax=Kitasatospora purpeofusca TaxID=67352 RepID=UPI003245797C
MTPTTDPGWAGKQVLVTGNSGFVGSWLSMVLTALGAVVQGYSDNAEPSSDRRARWLRDAGVETVRADVRDFERLSAVMAATDFDLVVHLAAQPLVGAGHRDPRLTFDTNVGGTVNLLEAARLTRPRALISVTSDKVYRNRSWPRPYRETDELGGGCPYSVSKAAAEIVFEGYADLYAAEPDGTRAASVRLGNVIGGGDFADRLVPNCLRAFEDAEPVILHDRAAARPWQHVLDVCQGLVLLAEGLLRGTVRGGERFNFAPPFHGATTWDLASSLATAWGDGAVVSDVEKPRDCPEEQMLFLDGRKAATALDWRHRFDLAAMAEAVVAWHRAVAAGTPPMVATQDQIDAFRFGSSAAAGVRPEAVRG